MTERESDGGKLGWLLLGGILASAWWWYRGGGSTRLPASVRQWRGQLATLLDEQGRHLGERLSSRTHTWSERLKPNGQSRRIPIEGPEPAGP
jgi:hypothetical protein